MNSKKWLSYCTAAGLLATISLPGPAAPTQTETSTLTSTQMFPFALPWDDASKTFIDVSSLNPAPLTQMQRIQVKDGHFYDQSGRRVRFLGVNFLGGANVPSKSDADKVAARMHKFGINCVRLHNINIYNLTPEKLDRFDYLVSALKKNGIYVDLNLHVGRTFTEADGMPKVGEQPHSSKRILWYQSRAIELQKEYAKMFLDHVNPYTGMRYADDPAIAVIELVNEDSLLNIIGWEDGYPQVYMQDLQQRWNTFLQNKYGTTEKLTTAWNKGARILGENLWTNPYAIDGEDKWTVEESDKNQPAQLEATNQPSLHIKTDTASTFFVKRNTSDLNEGQFYTLQFRAKSSPPSQMSVSYRLDEDNFRRLAAANSYQLQDGDKEYRFVFRVPSSLHKRTRIDFEFNSFKGEASISNLSLRQGSEVEMGAQSLENKSVKLNPLNYNGRCDYIEFLSGLELKFLQTMRNYLKDDLRSKAPVIGSQVTWGGNGNIAGEWRESHADYVDTHAYWSHPKFPHKAWDTKDWTVSNSPMILNLHGYPSNTFKDIAPYRIGDKPFTVSEYNHSNPNQYGAEMMPMLASYAAYQDWDGFFIFQYRGGSGNFRSDYIDTFFNVDNQPVKIGFFPAAARIFLADSPERADSSTKVLLLPEQQVPRLQADFDNMLNLWNFAGLPDDGYINNPLQVRFAPVDKPQIKTLSASGNGYIHLDWNVNSTAKTGLYTAFAPQWNAVVNYNSDPTPIKSGDLTITPLNKTRPFGAYTLTSMDNKPVNTSRKLLLTAGGFVENQDMGWNADRTSVGNQWGHGPVMAEGLEATITLKTKAHHVTVYALDTTGKEKTKVPSELHNGKLTFIIGPKFATMWYAIKAED